MKINDRLKAMETKTGLKLEALPKGATHQVGKTYYDSYWGQTYEVLDFKILANHWMEWVVTCRWKDGRITRHCTSLDPESDFLVLIDL